MLSQQTLNNFLCLSFMGNSKILKYLHISIQAQYDISYTKYHWQYAFHLGEFFLPWVHMLCSLWKRSKTKSN